MDGQHGEYAHLLRHLVVFVDIRATVALSGRSDGIELCCGGFESSFILARVTLTKVLCEASLDHVFNS